MTSSRSYRVVLTLVLGLAVACGPPPETYTTDAARTGAFPDDGGTPSWTRWGGPGGDFTVVDAGLAASWPAEGPPQLWSRELGPGYSAIVADRGALYTMYREGDDDVVLAVRADDGSTIWEHRYTAPAVEGNVVQFGTGPNATPLLVGDRLITLGYAGRLSCLDAADGTPVWTHELLGDLGGEALKFGYSASPILHDGRVIVLVGGEHAVIALDPADGSTVWAGAAGTVSYSTPIVIEVGGREQIVYYSADRINGIDAADGRPLWSHEVVNEYRNNSTDPTWDGELLWAATQLDGGTRALRLGADGATVEEVWFNRKIGLHYWNTVRHDGHVFASIGSNGSVLAGIEMATGEILWRERGFTQANFVHTGERTVLFDAEGELALVSLRPDGIEIHAQTTLVDGPTWTPPTLVGTRLYLRDTRSMRAIELGG